MTSAQLHLHEAAPELNLAAQFHDLHQLLYTRGGIRPVNSAIEELAKLLLLRVAVHRDPDLTVPGSGSLAELLDPTAASSAHSVDPWKRAFASVVTHEELRGRLPDGSTQAVWPLDEPLRISRTDVLSEALRILQQVGFGAATGQSIDPLGLVFDTFLQGRYDHAGGLGTYLTPTSVARTACTIGFELASSLQDGLVGDPCCGTGRFLAAAITQATSGHTDTDPTRWISEQVVGADQSPSSVAMARVNLLAYGASHPRVFTVSDSIIDENVDLLRGRFKLILTNPPFGEGKYDDLTGIRRTASTLRQAITRVRIDPALAFVGRCIDLLAPDGIAAIVLPDGLLNSPIMGNSLLHDGTLSRHVAVEGILSLPTATFAPSGTVAKTSVLFLRRSRGNRGGRVFVARAQHVGYVMRSGRPVPDPLGDDLPTISRALGCASAGAAATESQSASLAFTELEHMKSLDASSYDFDAMEARNQLERQGGQPFDAVLEAVEVERSPVTPDLPFLSVLHIDELGIVKWLAAESNVPATPGKIARPGDVVVSLLNPAKFRATVIPDSYERVQVSAEFGVFRSKIDPYAALALLQHPSARAQLAPLGRGTSSSRRRINTSDLLDCVCPPFDQTYIENVGNIVRQQLRAADLATRALAQALQHS